MDELRFSKEITARVSSTEAAEHRACHRAEKGPQIIRCNSNPHKCRYLSRFADSWQAFALKGFSTMLKGCFLMLFTCSRVNRFQCSKMAVGLLFRVGSCDNITTLLSTVNTWSANPWNNFPYTTPLHYSSHGSNDSAISLGCLHHPMVEALGMKRNCKLVVQLPIIRTILKDFGL